MPAHLELAFGARLIMVRPLAADRATPVLLVVACCVYVSVVRVGPQQLLLL